MNWFGGLVDLFRRAPPADPVIVVVEDGFDIVDGKAPGEPTRVRWDYVERISTRKLDLFTTDCVVLDFVLSDGKHVQVSEEWPGFADLFGPLQVAFPTMAPNWYFEVMTPAFEASRAVLFQRDRGE
jgi:hypothetical protein